MWLFSNIIKLRIEDAMRLIKPEEEDASSKLFLLSMK